MVMVMVMALDYCWFVAKINKQTFAKLILLHDFVLLEDCARLFPWLQTQFTDKIHEYKKCCYST